MILFVKLPKYFTEVATENVSTFDRNIIDYSVKGGHGLTRHILTNNT